MDLLKALFIGVFVTFPLGVLIRVSVTPQAYVYPVDLFVLLFVLYGLYRVLQKKKIVWFGQWKFFVGVAMCSLLINSLWLEPRALIVSSLYLFRLIAYFFMIPIIAYLFSKKDVQWLIHVISISLVTTVLIGVLQYFLYPDLRNLMYLGWDEHLYRVFSTFLDPNFASVLFVLLLWLLIFLFTASKNKTMRYVSGVCILLTGIGLLLTYSRTGYIAVIGSLVVYSLLNKNVKILGGFIVLLIAGLFFLPKNLQSEGVNLFRTASIESRVESYQTAIQIFQQQPIFGVGFNAYRYAQERHNLGTGNISGSHAGAGVSNSYIFVLVTTGVVGLGAFLYGIYKTIKEMYSLSNRQLRNTMIACVTALLVGSFTENILFYSFVLIVFCCISGITKLAMEKSER